MGGYHGNWCSWFIDTPIKVSFQFSSESVTTIGDDRAFRKGDPDYIIMF